MSAKAMIDRSSGEKTDAPYLFYVPSSSCDDALQRLSRKSKPKQRGVVEEKGAQW